MAKRGMTAQEYMEQEVIAGGEIISLGEIYSDFDGDDKLAGAWLAGYQASGGEIYPPVRQCHCGNRGYRGELCHRMGCMGTYTY